MKEFCNTCKNETNHEERYTHKKNYSEPHYLPDGSIIEGWYESYKYSFLVCLGCDTGMLIEKYTNSSMYDENGSFYIVDYHPSRTNSSDLVSKKFFHVDKKLKSAYEEIIVSYNHGLYIVCSMGIRALLEGICACEGIEDKKPTKTLNEKIIKLKENNRVPSEIIDGLKELKPIGDDAAHRLDVASKHHIGLAVELIEALLTHLYEAKFDLEIKAKQFQSGKKNILAELDTGNLKGLDDDVAWPQILSAPLAIKVRCTHELQ